MKNSLMTRARSCSDSAPRALPLPLSMTGRRLRRFAGDSSGFSIIELTIVLMVIGILVGMTLKGQDLLERARMQALKQDIKLFQTSVVSFREKYQALPGDMRSASTRLAPRGSVPVGNGNGNGLIETPEEQVQFWQHLALADLAKGITVTASPEPVFGETLPEARIGGGYSILFKKIYAARRHWIRLSRTPVEDLSDVAGILTPAQAFEVDRDLDDGSPRTGNVVAEGAQCLEGEGYGRDTKQQACTVYFSLE
jgi:prepilin-type N-terminal cleavage/methylation domain-containing protein